MKKKELFKELIVEFHNSNLPEIKERDIIIPIDINKIISVIGVRRTGKTYILFQTIKKILELFSKDKIIYINFEDERLDIAKDELHLLLEAYKELYPNNLLNEVFFFFDEIQNVKGWEKFIRRIYDNYSKNIFITGSNSKLLSKEIATSLRGRTLSFEIFPLSFKEFLKFNGFSVKDNFLYDINLKAKLIKYFNRYLFFGGFPELVFIKENSIKIKILQEYFNVMLYRDIVERFNIKSTDILKYFLKRIIENIGKPVSVNKIFNELKSQGYKVGKNSLYEIQDMLEFSYIIMSVKKYHSSVLKTEFSQQKLYLPDSGLVNALTFSYKNDYGKLLENLIAKELKTLENEFFYYKNSSECDFILIKEGELLPIQVSYSLSNLETIKREIKGLTDICKKLNLNTGIIITHNEKDEIKVDNLKINIIPACEFLLHQGKFI